MLVVDDGSPDGTGEIADALAAEFPGRIEVMHRTGRRGLGRSYIDGLRKAIAMDGVDLDLPDGRGSLAQPGVLPALTAAAANADVVIGSRYLNGVSVVNWPLHRIVLSTFANRYIRAVTRLSASDCTSGFRCWRREALSRLPLDKMVSDGYAFLVEMLFDAARPRLPLRRGADHLRRAAAGPVEAVVRGHPRVGGDAVAAGAARRTH